MSGVDHIPMLYIGKYLSYIIILCTHGFAMHSNSSIPVTMLLLV